MPVFKYKAVTKTGQIVENRVDETNQYILMKKLKRNDLLPIEVIQISSKSTKKVKRQKRNTESNDSVLKSIRNEEIQKSLSSKPSTISKIKKVLLKNERITKKDIAIFTEN